MVATEDPEQLYAEAIGLRESRESDRDDARARDLYRRAAEAGHSKACVNLAHMIEIGHGGPVDIAESISWLRRAAEAEDLLGQANLGRLLQEYGADDEALVWLDRAAERGSANARVWAAVVRVRDPASAAEAARVLHEHSDRNPVAACALATAYEHGRGVEIDRVEAERLYRHGVTLGGSTAALDLAILLLYGHEVGHEPSGFEIEEAIELLEQAADDGLFGACAELGEILATGRYSIAMDDERAVSLLERATHNVDPRPKGVLAWMALNDRAPNIEPSRAFSLCRDAAEAEDGIANRLLALMYRRGFGVREDPVAARRHAERAVELGESDGLLDVIGLPTLRQRAVHRIRSWAGAEYPA